MAGTALFVSWAGSLVLLSLVLSGGVSRSRRLVRRALDERARNLAQAHEEETRRHVADERLRIARDLDDSVIHSLAGIAVQAGVAADLLDADPNQAEAALLAIKQTSGEALDDLRATLGILRSETEPRRPAGTDELVQPEAAPHAGVGPLPRRHGKAGRGRRQQPESRRVP